MKTTIDLPDDLHRAVKARAALEGRSVRDVTIELYRRWLGELMTQSGTDPQGWLPGGLVPATRPAAASADTAARQAPARADDHAEPDLGGNRRR
jgi:hypothetical protein